MQEYDDSFSEFLQDPNYHYGILLVWHINSYWYFDNASAMDYWAWWSWLWLFLFFFFSFLFFIFFSRFHWPLGSTIPTPTHQPWSSSGFPFRWLRCNGSRAGTSWPLVPLICSRQPAHLSWRCVSNVWLEDLLRSKIIWIFMACCPYYTCGDKS